jgi:hypothetical protein
MSLFLWVVLPPRRSGTWTVETLLCVCRKKLPSKEEVLLWVVGNAAAADVQPLLPSLTAAAIENHLALI